MPDVKKKQFNLQKKLAKQLAKDVRINAKRTCSICCTSVPSESVFNIAGYIKRKERSSLS